MLKEIIQAGSFYENLSDNQKKDLIEAIAEDIFFLEEDLQFKVIKLLRDVNKELGDAVESRNDFTM